MIEYEAREPMAMYSIFFYRNGTQRSLRGRSEMLRRERGVAGIKNKMKERTTSEACVRERSTRENGLYVLSYSFVSCSIFESRANELFRLRASTSHTRVYVRTSVRSHSMSTRFVEQAMSVVHREKFSLAPVGSALGRMVIARCYEPKGKTMSVHLAGLVFGSCGSVRVGPSRTSAKAMNVLGMNGHGGRVKKQEEEE